MIKNIVFDFGNVLVKDMCKALEDKVDFDNLPEKTKWKYIKAFRLSEVGRLPTKELLKTIHQTIAPDLTPREAKNYVLNTKALPPWKLALKLKNNYRVIIFSNNQKSWPSKIAAKLNMDFKGIPFINSAYVGLRKPDKKFFKLLLGKYRLSPEETIFIDDKEKNIKPAEALKIKTFCYRQDIKKLKSFLKKQGVKGI